MTIEELLYRQDIERIQHEHDLEAARIVREGKAETAAFLKLMKQAEQRQRQRPKAAPIEAPSRKCACGAPLEKRQRFCPKCRQKNRRKTWKRQKQKQAGWDSYN